MFLALASAGLALVPNDKDALYNQVLIKAAAGDLDLVEKLSRGPR